MKPYFLNPSVLGKVQNVIDDWLKQDINEKSTSLYSSPAFLTNRNRLVINYSSFNKLIEPIDYPIGYLEKYPQYFLKLAGTLSWTYKRAFYNSNWQIKVNI